MRLAALCLTLILCVSTLPGLTQEEFTPLFSFDSIETASITYSANNPANKLEVNADEQYLSEGAGSVRLSSVSPEGAGGNTYVGFSIRLPEPVDMAKRSIVFDAWTTEAENTRALYVRGYDTENVCALSWNNWSQPVKDEKTTVVLYPGMSYEGFGWERQVAESPNRDEITRLEFIIGTHAKGVPFSMTFDDLRLGTVEFSAFNDVEKPKPLFLDTPLVKDGAANAVILCPEGAEWQQVASDLQAAVAEKLNVTLPIQDATQITDEAMRDTQIIALGAISNNRRLLYLYSHQYTYADDYYPGPDGYVVQSIHDPWGTGNNVLLIGASTPAGATAGVEPLLAAVSDAGVAGPVFDVKLTGTALERHGGLLTREPDAAYQESQHRAAESALEKGAHTGLFGQIARAGSSYAQTRKDGYAELFAWLVRRAKEHYDTDPTTFGGPWGMDSDFQIHAVMPMWDQVEESPALSDEDRLAVSKILFQWVSEVGVSSAQSVVGNERVRHNHQTFPALGLLFAGDYFSKHYNAIEAKRWIEISDAAFQFQAKAFKPYEDCNGYQWLTLYHTMRYALAKPDFSFFENGNARRCSDYAVLSMDNLGYSVTYGDTGAFVGWWSEMPFLRGALWYYQDARYAWVLDKKVAVSGRFNLGEYTIDFDGQRPDDLVGSNAWPVDPYYYRSWGGADRVPEENAVDKVVFRNGFDPDDQYMLLDGLSNGGHKHLDGNSISRWSENGRIWLADADYILSLPKYHNGVLILKDGQSAPIPDFVELEHIVDLPSFGASTTTYRDYAGVDWHRNILWLKDKYFVVADRMVAKEDGDYSFRIIWNTVGEVALTDSGLSIHQDGQYAQIAITPDCRLLLDDDPAYGKNWAAYEYIEEPVVRVLRAVREVRLESGEQVTLFSLLHASGAEPSAAELVRLDENTAAVRGLEEPVIVSIGGTDEPIEVFGEARLYTDALVSTPIQFFSVGTTRVEVQGQVMMDRPEGFDAEADILAGQALMAEPSIRTAGAEPQFTEQQMGPRAGMVLTDYIDGLIAAAVPMDRPAGAALTTPAQLQALWDYRETLDSYMITGNRGAFEAVDCGLQMSASPDPLPANVFSGAEGKNTVDNITDGDLLATEGGVMWDVDQPVTVDLAFDNEYDLSRIVLKAWFATSSSKNKLFQLGTLTVDASSDGFAGDSRRIVDLTDTEMHGNWGEPGHAPHIYAFDDINASAQQLRLTLTPRPGTAIYISELEVYGDREGLAEEYAAAPDRDIPIHTMNAVKLIDLVGNDGVDEIVAGTSSGKVYAIGADGSDLWQVEVEGAVNDLAAVDFEGDGQPAIVVGGMGGYVVALSTAGEELWRFQVPYYKRVGHVRTVFAADLTGDGKQVAVVGADNWHFYAIDAAGEEIWHYESVHGSTCGAAADVDADGKDDVVCGTEYYWWHVVRPDGKSLFRYSTRGGPHANVVATARLDEDEKRSVLFGGADGNVHVLGPDGKLRWLFNTGDEVTGLAAADINGDGRDEILAGSMSFNVYALDAEGKALWRRDVGSEVTTVTTVDGDAGLRVLVGCRNGGLYTFDAADGTPLASTQEDDAILRTTVGRGEDNKAVAGISTEGGYLRLIGLD